MDGDAYESWVTGLVVETGQPKGRLRNDPAGLRFVEVTINGPKSWSLAAALSPEVSTALDAAQERAARQIIGYLAEHARPVSDRVVGRCKCRSSRSRRR